MLHVERNIYPEPTTASRARSAVVGDRPAAGNAGTPRTDLVDGILTELQAAVRELRCGALTGVIRRDVSMTHLHVLWLLAHRGEMSMTELADVLGISLSNATGLMDRMEERGLIERVRVPDDRRRVFVRPAAGGRLGLQNTEGLKRDRMRRVLERLDERQLRRALLAFRDFRTALVAESGAPEHQHYFVDPD